MKLDNVIKSVVEQADFLVLLQAPGQFKTDETEKPGAVFRDPSYFEGRKPSMKE